MGRDTTIKQISEKEQKSQMSNLRKRASELFEGISDNYRQGMVYRLLNCAKGGKKEEFIELTIRYAAGQMKDKKVAEFCNEVSKTVENSSESSFREYAHSIILGIMSQKEGR